MTGNEVYLRCSGADAAADAGMHMLPALGFRYKAQVRRA